MQDHLNKYTVSSMICTTYKQMTIMYRSNKIAFQKRISRWYILYNAMKYKSYDHTKASNDNKMNLIMHFGYSSSKDLNFVFDVLTFYAYNEK